jgi:hypothetical protein
VGKQGGASGLHGYQLDGDKRRTDARVKWWKPELTRLKEAAIGPKALMEKLPDVPLPADFKIPPYAGPPAVFGHYWFTGDPAVLARNLSCVDYSACAGGQLVAYRWEGEPRLASEKMIAV